MNRLRLRYRVLSLLLFVLSLSYAAPAAKKNTPKLAETIDLPSTFDVDFSLAATQRTQIQTHEVSDDAAGAVGKSIFESLVTTQMISGFGLPYRWSFRVNDNPTPNAGSYPDGEVEANEGIARLLGQNRGLWAAVLSHEIAHVARRHVVKKFLFHQYIQQQVEYWQLRARLGDKYAGWTALGMRISGALLEKKLSRDLESDADTQGMLIMAQAGYHPDYVFAMHHLLRIKVGEQSKLGTFFFSDHPRWETRDQRSERAYIEALAEYTRLYPNPADSPGGAAPAVAFLGSIHGVENKNARTGDLVLPLTCRNLVGPIDLVIHLTDNKGSAISSPTTDYRDSAGSPAIHQHASCLDTESATPTIVHIPAAVVPEHERKVKAQVDLLGPDQTLLEHSRTFDVHFPKANKKTGTLIAKVWVEPNPSDSPTAGNTAEYASATAGGRDEHPRASNIAPPETAVESKKLVASVAPVTSNVETLRSGNAIIKTRVTAEKLGILPSAVDSSGRTSYWENPVVPVGSGAWWTLPSPLQTDLHIRLSETKIFFPTQPLDTVSKPLEIVVTNDGATLMTISAIVLEGNNASDFSQTNNCRQIEPKATCTVFVSFSPTGSGTRTATLVFGEAAQRVMLGGIGR